MKTYSLKVAEDDPIALYLSEQTNVSATLRYIVEQYLSQGGGAPPPPEPPPTAPVGGFTLEALTQAVYQGILLAKQDGISIMQNAPLNKANGHAGAATGSADAAQTADPTATAKATDIFLNTFG